MKQFKILGSGFYTTRNGRVVNVHHISKSMDDIFVVKGYIMSRKADGSYKLMYNTWKITGENLANRQAGIDIISVFNGII